MHFHKAGKFYLFFSSFDKKMYTNVVCFLFHTIKLPIISTSYFLHVLVTFGDDAIAKRIMATQSPWEHKRLGRQVRNFSDVVWTSRSVEIVLKGNMLKVIAVYMRYF